jgi:hypothetical protein
MLPAREQYKQYTALYHDFTEAYTNVHSLSREFYPMAKRFVEDTEPELTGFVEKISRGQAAQSGSYSYQNLVNYMNHFDDFTLDANVLFTDLKLLLGKSDNFMTRVIDLKLSHKNDDDNSLQYFMALMPELSDLITGLKQIPERANSLEEKMKRLENEWSKTKEKII